MVLGSGRGRPEDVQLWQLMLLLMNAAFWAHGGRFVRALYVLCMCFVCSVSTLCVLLAEFGLVGVTFMLVGDTVWGVPAARSWYAGGTFVLSWGAFG